MHSTCMDIALTSSTDNPDLRNLNGFIDNQIFTSHEFYWSNNPKLCICSQLSSLALTQCLSQLSFFSYNPANVRQFSMDHTRSQLMIASSVYPSA